MCVGGESMLEKIKKHKKLTIALVIVLIVAILIGVVVHNVKKTGSDMMDMSMGVQAFHLEQQDMSSTVSTSGTVESANVVEVTTEVTSPIKELNVALGDHVEKGQVLCTFDGEEIRQQIADLESQNAAVKKADQSSKQKAQRALEQAQAQANAKAAALAETQRVYQTVSSLVGSEGTTGEQQAQALVDAQLALQTAQSEYDAAQSSVQDAQDAVNSSDVTTTDSSRELNQLYQQLNHLTVVAEQSGVITQLNVSKGSIPSGALMKIEDDTTLKVNVNIKEKDILKLAAGQKATITSDAIGSDQTFTGTVEKVINFTSGGTTGVDGAQTGGYSATIALEAGTPLLLGMSVKVEILLNEEGEQLAVPYDAIAQDDDGTSYLYRAVEQENGKYQVERVTVTTGVSNDYYTAVTSDELEEGDVIINYPLDVTEGDEITLYFPEEQDDLLYSEDAVYDAM